MFWPTLGNEVIILSTLGGAAMSVAIVTSVSSVMFCVPVASLKMSASCWRAFCFRGVKLCWLLVPRFCRAYMRSFAAITKLSSLVMLGMEVYVGIFFPFWQFGTPLFLASNNGNIGNG